MSHDPGPVARAVETLRSIVFYGGYALSATVHGSAVLLIAPWLDYPTRYRLLMRWNRFVIAWLGLVCGVRHEVTGIENLPSRGCVVVANHQSSWETLYLATLFPQLCILLKRELLRIPVFGWALALMRPIAIDRDNPRAALKQVVEHGSARLAENCSVLIFPQGTRVDAGEALRFSRSAAQLAIRAGAEIVCVAHDAGRCWPARRFRKSPGLIRVMISEPMPSAGREAGELTQAAQDWIEARLAQFAHASSSGRGERDRGG